MATSILSDLNTVMRDFPSFIIVPENAGWKQNPVLQVLKSRVDRDAFKGKRIEVKIKTKIGGYAEGTTETQDIPGGRSATWATQYVDLKRVIANAQLTSESIDRVKKGDNAWIDAVADSLADMRLYFNYVLEIACLGNGTGIVAEVSAAADSGGVVTVTCDNDYTKMGIENTQALQKGMLVDFYQSNGTTLRLANKEVTAVTVGKRTAAGAYAVPTGTFTITHAPGHGIVDGDLVVLKNSLNALPMGLGGIVQDGTHFTAVYGRVATFQNLTRTSYPSLQSTIYQATDFGLTSESPVDGVPTLWAPSTISDAITEAEANSGVLVTDLFCHSDLASALNRLNASSNSISVNVAATTGIQQIVVGNQHAKFFETADGRQIPIHVCRTMPRYVLKGVSADTLHWSVDEEFDFLRLFGDIWGPTKDDRKADYEAPFRGRYELWTERCDGSFDLQDLRVDV